MKAPDPPALRHLMSGCSLYILRCADGSYYTGTSRAKDIETRVSQHNLGVFGGFTAKRRPVILVYSAHFERTVDAIAMEQQVEGWSRAKKEALIRGDYEKLPELAKRRQAFPRSNEPPSSFETQPSAAPQDEGSG